MFWYVLFTAYRLDPEMKFRQDILKKYRFDLPAGIEHDYANWEKISTYVGYSLTQSRSRVKKLVSNMVISLIIRMTLLHIDQGKH